MPEDDNIEKIFITGEPLPIEVSQIDQALRQLWAEQHSHSQRVTRACVLNLVVFAGDEASGEIASDIIAKLTATHPCRALVLLSDVLAEEAQLQAWLSAHCQLPKPSGHRICCEQITIRAAGEAMEHMPSTVLPLLVPDLPVVLWWMGEPPFGATVFDHLVSVADRLIVDTRSFRDPTFALASLAGLLRSNANRISVADLNWARLSAWQEHLSRLFDSVETLPYLMGIERIAVHYAVPWDSPRTAPEQALLFVGWLLSRLGWKMPPALARVAPGSFRGRLRRAGRELAIDIIPKTLDAETTHPDLVGTLSEVVLSTRHGERKAVFSVSRQYGESDCMTTYTHLEERLEPLRSTSQPQQGDLASLLAEDLMRFDQDYLFEAALETAVYLSGGTQLVSL